MGARRRRGRASQPQPALPRVDLRSIACGLVVALLVVLPALFNPRGQTAFGVVKSGLLQVLGVLAGTAAVLDAWIERRRPPAGALTLAAGAVVAVYVLATVFGIAPALSFFAPDVRHEGTYVILALAAAGFAVSTFDAGQIEAVVLAVVIGSIGPSVYQLSEFLASAWTESSLIGTRAGSTLGNPILFGGYLVTVIPITLAVAIGGLTPSPQPHASGRRWNAAWWLVLALQVAALGSARAKGGVLATLVGLMVVGAAMIDLDTRWRRLTAVIAIALLIGAIAGGGLLLRLRYGDRLAGQTVEVRELIWRQVARTIAGHRGRLPLGVGPGRLQALAAPYATPRLANLEGFFAVPDRSHNELLDTIVDAGIIGAMAVLALHAVLWAQFARHIWKKRPTGASPPRRTRSLDWLAIGLLAGAVAHFVDIQIGIATMVSRLVWWSSIGIAAASYGHRPAMPERPGVPTRLGIEAAIGSGAATAALAFGFWQTAAGISGAGAIVLAATAMTALALGFSVPRTSRAASPLSLVAVTGAIVLVMLFLLAIGTWGSHEATMVLVFFLALGAIGGYAIAGSSAAPRQSQLLAACALVPVGILLVMTSAPPARADLLSAAADRLGEAHRWTDAAALDDERVRLTPESDLAWSALGNARLEVAKTAGSGAQRSWFEQAASALAEARRRNPIDWSHVRNQASAERVWAVYDPAGRAAHLEAANRYFQQASEMVPAFGRLWAEWGNVDAERGHLHEAFVKLDHAASLPLGHDAKVVADAIFLATGVDIRERPGRARAAADLNRERLHALAGMYADPPPAK